MQQKILWLLLFASVVYHSPERDEMLVGTLILLTILTLHEVVGVNILRFLDQGRKETGIALGKEKQLKEKALILVSDQSRTQITEVIPQLICLEEEMGIVDRAIEEEFGKVDKNLFTKSVNEKLLKTSAQVESVKLDLTVQLKKKIFNGIAKKLPQSPGQGS